LQISIKEAILEIEMFQKINSSTFHMLANSGALKTFQKGVHVFRDREEVHTIYFIISGFVTLYKIDSLGEKKVIFVFGKNAMINEDIFQESTASISCEVQERAILLCFPKRLFLQAVEQDFELSKAVQNAMSLKIRRLYRQLKNTSNSLRVDKRIAAKLWKLANDYGKQQENGTLINLEISITYLSDMLASKRETVSRQVKLLAEKGLIIVQKGHFVIPDMKALSDYFKNE